MTVHLYLAPTSSGKTAYVLNLVRAAAAGLRCIPRVVVPTQLQMRSWRRRLAQAGGAMGVRLMTFDGLYAECLNAAGEVYASLSDPVQHRLISMRWFRNSTSSTTRRWRNGQASSRCCGSSWAN